MSRMSEKRKQAIYSAVATAITDLRIKLAKQVDYRTNSKGTLSAGTVDAELFYLEQRAGAAAILAATEPARSR